MQSTDMKGSQNVRIVCSDRSSGSLMTGASTSAASLIR